MRLLLEPLNTQDNPGYFPNGQCSGETDHQSGKQRQRLPPIRLLPHADHGGVLAETVKANIDIIRHFQIGGVSGRHEPDDTEEINCPYLFDLIDDLGFDGWVGCEYRPSVGTVEGLAWARPYGIGG